MLVQPAPATPERFLRGLQRNTWLKTTLEARGWLPERSLMPQTGAPTWPSAQVSGCGEAGR